MGVINKADEEEPSLTRASSVDQLSSLHALHQALVNALSQPDGYDFYPGVPPVEPKNMEYKVPRHYMTSAMKGQIQQLKKSDVMGSKMVQLDNKGE